MYAGVIRSAVHTTFRRSLTIATVHARFNLTQIAYEGRKKGEPLQQPSWVQASQSSLEMSTTAEHVH